MRTRKALWIGFWAAVLIAVGGYYCVQRYGIYMVEAVMKILWPLKADVIWEQSDPSNRYTATLYLAARGIDASAVEVGLRESGRSFDSQDRSAKVYIVDAYKTSIAAKWRGPRYLVVQTCLTRYDELHGSRVSRRLTVWRDVRIAYERVPYKLLQQQRDHIKQSP